MRSYIFLCLGAEGQRQIQQKRPNLELHNVSTQELITTLEDIFVTPRVIAFERYNFIFRKQKKTERLEEFDSDLVELASRADCVDREDEWVRYIFTAHMNNDKIAEELLAQTRSPQDAYAIRREKGIEHSRTMKTNPFRGHQITPKQEPVNKELPTQVVKSSIINAEISIIKTIYSPAPQKIKFVPNSPNGATSLKYAVPHRYTI